MASYVFMKVLESAPERYDRGIDILSLGNYRRIQQKIVEGFIDPGDNVLEMGCGTGTLAVSCARKGALVVGFDASPAMLAVARRKVEKHGFADKIRLLEMGAIEMDKAFDDGSFDKILSTLVFSEMYPDERKYALGQAYRVLRSGGLLVIADEVRPASLWKRILRLIIRIPLLIITYILTQTTTRALQSIVEDTGAAGFEVIHQDKMFLESLGLYVARKA